jgi:diguanylate cyclase (GGDEF)-like protein/PAS domain S-box-containing protein
MANLIQSPAGGVFSQWSMEPELLRGMVEALTNNATVAFQVCDVENTVLYVNDTFSGIFGWTREEVLGTRLPTVREQDWSAMQASLLEQKWSIGQAEAVRLRKDGSSFPASETITPIANESGDIYAYTCITRDITDRKKAEWKLQESEQRFKSLFEQNPDAVISLQLDGTMTDANPAAQSLMACTGCQLVGTALLDLIVPEEQLVFQLRFLQAKRSGTQHFDSAILDCAGNRVELNVLLLPILIDEDVAGIYCIAKDITVHKKALDTIHFMAFHDSLTELPNRRLFHNRLTEALSGGNQHIQPAPMAVVWIDLDGFKSINDTYGHAAGDYVLHEVAVRLRGSVRSDDLVARVGGDEFTIFMQHITCSEDATKLAHRLLQVLGEPIPYRDATLQISPSIGIALYPENGRDVDTLLNHADTAMYEVKQSGKNGYRLFHQALVT